MRTTIDDRPAAVVTGAARGIGRAVSDRMVAEGYHVVAIDLTAPRATGEHVTPVALDVRAIEEAEHLLDTLDVAPAVLVNNAAHAPRVPLDELDAATLRRTLEINLEAPVLWSIMIAGRLREVSTGGAIVNVSSVNALRGMPHMIHYNTSKAGLISATRTLAVELADRGIRVNAVCPGSTATEIWEPWSQDVKDRLADRIPLGRFAAPDEIASAVWFLASPEAAFVTGHTLVADGGLTQVM